MDKRLNPLLTPWKIGKCEIKNRIVLTSMGGTDLFGWMEKNHFDKEGAKFILEVAKNNAGLVLPGCQPVYNPMFGQWLHKNKKMYKDLAEWMPEFHKTGAKLFVQLTAGFGRSFTISKMMEMLYTTPVIRTLSKPVMDLDMITASASPSPNRWSDKVPSREMTKDEIHKMIHSFAESSKMLMDAGVDGVEVHAVVSLRYSVVSKTKGFREGALPGEEFTEVGRDMAESEKAAKLLQDAGYDMLNCDNGTYDAWYWAHPPIYMPENCNLEDVEHIRQFVSIPVVAAGRLDPYVAAEAIEEGKLDGAGFARQFLADQEWVTKLIEDRPEDIRPCILCHNGCFNMCHYKGVPNDQDLSDSLHLARCAVNAETMQWNKHYIKKADKPKTVAIIGGGIGGMEAARVLAQRGHKPVIYEKEDSLGGTFIAASAESYKGKLRDLLTWYRRQMDKLGIEIHLNTEVKDLSQIKADEYIVATGAKARKLNIPGFDKTIEACDFLTGTPVGNSVAVIGGGLTGCEIAYELALSGKDVKIIEMKDDLISQKGVCLANSSYLREWFQWKKTPVYLEAAVKEVKDGSVIISLKDGSTKEIPCDSVISSVGYIPDPITQEKGHVHLVGDCLNVGNLRTVIWKAYETAMKI